MSSFATRMDMSLHCSQAQHARAHHGGPHLRRGAARGTVHGAIRATSAGQGSGLRAVEVLRAVRTPSTWVRLHLGPLYPDCDSCRPRPEDGRFPFLDGRGYPARRGRRSMRLLRPSSVHASAAGRSRRDSKNRQSAAHHDKDRARSVVMDRRKGVPTSAPCGAALPPAGITKRNRGAIAMRREVLRKLLQPLEGEKAMNELSIVSAHAIWGGGS